MWRPKEWGKLKCEDCKDAVIDEYGYVCEIACGERARYFNFEAGADAMLKALKSKGTKIHLHGIDDEKGTIVFIPEEESCQDNQK